MIFECIGKCEDDSCIYLIYENKEERKFAPQYRLTDEKLTAKIKQANDDGHIVKIEGLG